MSKSKSRIWCAAFLLLFLIAVAPVQSPAQSWKQVIVTASPTDLTKIQNAIGAAIVDAAPGQYLLVVPSSVAPSTIAAIQGTAPIQAANNVTVSIEHGVPKTTTSTIWSSGSTSGSTWTAGTSSSTSAGSVTYWYGSPARQAYTTQWAIGRISLNQALSNQPWGGFGMRVALIDTGVDEKHPTLKAVLWGGKNYLNPAVLPDELNDPVVLGQSTADVLDQSTADVLDQSTADVLDQSTADVLDQSTADVLDGAAQLPEFGHGTMMAGLVHLVAPHAMIMPFKAFDANGSATEWNVMRAIYDAVAMGANVINMSFSSTSMSAEMATAVQYASSHGVIVVAAAGNDNSNTPTYPASVTSVIGVTGTDSNDQKAVFSNFGSYVDLSSPGVGLVSTYPGGLFARGSGTSGATALVSGLAALVKTWGTSASTVRSAIESGADSISLPPQYQGQLGKGRINAAKAVNGND